MTTRRKQSSAEALADAFADAEMFLGETIAELDQTLKNLKATKAKVHMKRMTLARAVKAAAGA